MYWEALRAPEDMTNWRRNPYIRENRMKALYGKTAEERKKNLAAAKE